MDTPSVFSPGNACTLPSVALNPNRFSVLPAKKKSSEMTAVDSGFHGKPGLAGARCGVAGAGDDGHAEILHRLRVSDAGSAGKATAATGDAGVGRRQRSSLAARAVAAAVLAAVFGLTVA
ncbi:hypothetical protein OsI_13963 [Oryza sativa Indica Group]|uniref:Uncharacterized protein n=1 Tax=Oryza sativa subsp. indica TaxID=39946 RepID=B8ALS2_ORYSI|nr:hypothetical protein OsI_13963 [Oryza sativa Indica Group]